MIDPRRSLLQHAGDSPELPRVSELSALYRHDWKPRKGELMMFSGRSGSGKSTFSLFWLAKMNLDALYFSSDMTASQVGYKLAAMMLEEDMDGIEREWREGESAHERVLSSLADLRLSFSYGGITYAKIESTLDAYVELHDKWPDMIIIDNLMDVEGCESDYTAQQEAMQYLHEVKSQTGASVLVLHHCSDKSWDAATDPFSPPGRKEIKNGMSEKPEQILTLALNPHTGDCNVAVVKQRMGKSDPTGRSYATIGAVPSQSRYVNIQESRPMYVVHEEGQGSA